MKMNAAPIRRFDARNGSGVVAAPAVLAQQKIEMKLAYFVGDQHAMSQWLIKWSDKPGEAVGRAYHGQALPRPADGPGAAAL